MHQALKLKKEVWSEKFSSFPCERTIYRIMQIIGLIHTKHKHNSLTKADKEAKKSEDLLKRNFKSEAPLKKCVTDITEVKTAGGKLYISALEDCFDGAILGISMEDHMRAELTESTIKNSIISNPNLRGAIVHLDRGSQYTSEIYRKVLKKYGITQSMNSAAGRCHDNAKCESLWGRFKEELI